MRGENQLLQDLTYGAVAGIVGTVVMQQASSVLYRFEAPEKKQLVLYFSSSAMRH